MKMKFYSEEPNLHIIRQRMAGNRVEHFELCMFDENCELETEDKEVIRQLLNIYRHEEVKEESAEEVEAKEVEEVKEDETDSEKTMFHCKKCDFETDNKGLLMAHYREIHPKK